MNRADNHVQPMHHSHPLSLPMLQILFLDDKWVYLFILFQSCSCVRINFYCGCLLQTFPSLGQHFMDSEAKPAAMSTNKHATFFPISIFNFMCQH